MNTMMTIVAIRLEVAITMLTFIGTTIHHVQSVTFTTFKLKKAWSV